MLASLTLILQADGNTALLVLGSTSLAFALFNVVGGFLVTDRMLAMFSRKPASPKSESPKES
jgi:NAD(P) transhydrogenase subunit alpha